MTAVQQRRIVDVDIEDALAKRAYVLARLPPHPVAVIGRKQQIKPRDSRMRLLHIRDLDLFHLNPGQASLTRVDGVELEEQTVVWAGSLYLHSKYRASQLTELTTNE